MFAFYPRRSVPVLSLVWVVFLFARCSFAQEAGLQATAEGLTPCLAVLCDGSPVYPSEAFPPAKHITVAFRLPKDATAKALKSKWIALDGGEKVLAENSLDLQGQKRGWLRLELKEQAVPGKYRVDTMLDDKPWKTVNVEITPPITKDVLEKPRQLLIVEDVAPRTRSTPSFVRARMRRR